MSRLPKSLLFGKELFAIRNDKVVRATIQMPETNRGVVTRYKMRTDEIAEGESHTFVVDKKYTGTNREEVLRRLFKLKLKGLI